MTTIGDTLTPDQRAKLGVSAPPAEDDWLTGAACKLDENGNVDPDCEACQ